MKYFLFITVLMACFLFSCKDQSTGTNATKATIVGYWQLERMIVNDELIDINDEDDVPFRLSFSSNGQALILFIDEGVLESEPERYTWQIQGNLIVLTPEDVPDLKKNQYRQPERESVFFSPAEDDIKLTYFLNGNTLNISMVEVEDFDLMEYTFTRIPNWTNSTP